MRRVTKDEALADMAARGFSDAGGCAMCRLVRADDGLRVRESEHAVVVLDRYPAARGHLLVIYREHVERVAELSLADHLEIQALVHEAHLVVERAFAPKRVYAATFGTGIPHLHAHVVPVTEEGDAARPASVFTWSSNVSLYDEGEAEALAAALVASWP